MSGALGKTADISLITGLPGSGKSLRAVGFIKRALAAGEVVFVCNLNGLKLPHIPFEDPRKWQEIPAGSVLVVDEAQEFFRTRRGGDPPDYLTAMERIRHRGVRLVLMTQQPDYLDTHLRGLVGLHEHLLRENGKEASKIWRHNELMDNVRSEKARGRYDSEVWDFPKEDYDAYESAEVHTRKKVMSSRMKRGLIFLAAAAVAGCFIAYKFLGFFNPDLPEATAGGPPVAGGDARGPVERPTGADRVDGLKAHEPQAVAEFVARHQPRVSSLPWSAPIYDGRQAVAEPRVFCMDAGAGLTAQGEFAARRISCVTEQGSVHAMAEWESELLARQGEPYNPYKQPREDLSSMGEGERQDAPAPRVAGIGIGAEGRAVEQYGQFRNEPKGPDGYQVQGW